MYLVQKVLTKLNNNECSGFLDPQELNDVKRKLDKNSYSIYYPYKDSEKNIIYNKKLPNVLLYEIKSKIKLKHQDILGTMFSLSISKYFFGDIIIINDRYFIYILDNMRNYFESNLLMIKNSHVELEEIDLNYLENYEREYQKIEIIVSSNRIDTIISNICHIGRNNINEMIKNKEIMLNYDYLKNNSYKLKNDDIFSVKKIGKFKYNGIIKNTKSNNLIIEILKYI